MKMSEVKELSEVELEAKGRDLRVELFNLRIQKTTAQLEKPHRVKQIRRDVARMETRLTELRQKKQESLDQ
ncbi:MAG: 50S ribosomal protein L29 [Verrucomicrobiota bacterium]|jgi:large subunit ribosomal protein L29|nr:50S ribosomal protein L29 [Verrucomicrobiota bacterium]